jgi:hypothetical protein
MPSERVNLSAWAAKKGMNVTDRITAADKNVRSERVILDILNS